MGGYFRNQPPQQPEQPPQPPKQPNIPSPIPPLGSPQRPNYDPNQRVEVPYEQYMGAPTPQPQIPGYRQPVQLPTWVPEWFPRDPVILAALGGGLTVAVFASLCLCVLVLLPGAAISRTNTATPPLSTTTTVLVVTATPQGPVTATPPIGALINPFISANMPGLTAIGIQLLDPSTGAYVAGPIISANTPEMDQFTTAFNITAGVVEPDLSCPSHLKFYIQRADGSVIDFGACLKGVVILRGSGIQGLGTGDLPMGPFFTDVLYPLLPPIYQQLLTR